MLWIIAGVAVIGAVVSGPIASNVEQAKYDVREAHGAFEVRDYAPHIVAETTVSGEQQAAISQGFRTIADYIFGNNSASTKVAMTAPVAQQPNEKIAMTAPVIQHGNEKQWSVQFVMPASYTLSTLPKPNNDAVKLHQVAAKRYAVVRFSGTADPASLKQYSAELQTFIDREKLKAISTPTYAFYNPPWTLPFMRRNEVMIEIAK